MSFAQALRGDPLMPVTAKPGWPALANMIRNAYLAKFVWKEFSVIDLGAIPQEARRVMFGEDQVMPGSVLTRFIAVKHGHEGCRFAVINAEGHTVPFDIIARGAKEEITQLLAEHFIGPFITLVGNGRRVRSARVFGLERLAFKME